MLKHSMFMPMALLLFLALLTFWISQAVQEQTRHLNEMKRHDPDYLIYDFVSARTDAQGHTRFVLAASQLSHFPDNNTAELMRPRFTQFGLNKPYTQIVGQRGLVTNEGELVEFYTDVKVVRAATATKGAMELKTERLTIEPDKALARTTAPVVIRQQPATVITANGMQFDKNAQILQLFNRAHVHYERSKSVEHRAESAPKKSAQQPWRKS